MADPRAKKLSPETAQKLIDAGKTPRGVELERYQAFYQGDAYKGRPSFYDDSIPLPDRGPNVFFRLAKIAGESNAAFALGEGRFPRVLAPPDDSGLSVDAGAALDTFNEQLVELGDLESVFEKAYKMGQAARSAALVLGFRSGLPFADLVWSKLATPTFGDPADPARCTRLEIRYRYTEPWKDPQITAGEWWIRVFEYLRVIDDQSDTVYAPAPIWEVTDPGVTLGSPTQSKSAHGFGFCPVWWYARQRESLVGANYDGIAVHDGLCGMIEALDVSLSQKHRAALYTGDPTTVISGVSDEDPIGRQGTKPSALPGDTTAAGRQWGKAFGQPWGSTGNALRRGAGEVWRIPDASGKATILALSGDALQCLDDDAKDLASKLCDDMGVTIIDPSVFSGGGDLSGRTLAFIFSKQINRVAQDRKDIGKNLILPVLNLFYRMLLARSDGVYLPGLSAVLPILSKFLRPVAGGPMWFSPQLKLKWGDYFEPSDVDESTRAATAIAALAAGMILKKTAVEHVRTIFAIGDVDAYVKLLDKEAADKAALAAASNPNAQSSGGGGAGGAAVGLGAGSQSPPAAPPKPKRKAPMASNGKAQ